LAAPLSAVSLLLLEGGEAFVAERVTLVLSGRRIGIPVAADEDRVAGTVDFNGFSLS
jgi:hypothetical protein